MRCRLALLASCVAVPALAQEVPAIENNQGAVVQARAQAEAQSSTDAQLRAQAIAQAQFQAAQAQTAAQANSGSGQGTVPRTMPPAISPVAPDKPLPPKASAYLSVSRRWTTKFQRPHMDEDGVVHFLEGKGQVFVVGAVYHATDIMLAAGEHIVGQPIFGDPEQWKAQVAMSGFGRKARQHVLIKPTDAALSTNVVIATNKRSVSIELVSRRADYMPKVALDMPDDGGWGSGINMAGLQPGAPAITDPCDQSPTIGPDQYRASGDNVLWKPVQVYAVSTPVGIKTCIEFPSSIGSQDLPAILALADDGGWFSNPTKKIVNVRFLKRRYEADELLNRFVLVDGVGSNQQSVQYVRKGN